MRSYADTFQVIGEQPGRRVRDTEPPRRRSEGGGQDSGPIHRPRPTRPLLITQALQPRRGIAVPPRDHRRPRHTNPLGDLGVGDPIGGQQHDPRSLRQAGTDRTRTGSRLQQLTITRSKAQRLRAHPSFSRTPPSNYFRRAALASVNEPTLLMKVRERIRHDRVPLTQEEFDILVSLRRSRNDATHGRGVSEPG